jgi:hypothetical protein
VNKNKVVRDNFMLELPVLLSDADLLRISRDKATAELALEQLEAQFADTKRDWGKRIADQEAKIAGLRLIVRDGAERKPVECVEVYITEGEDRGRVVTVRKDTSEIVERRAANLLEARGVEETNDQQRDAAKTQKDAGVEEDDEGDVVPPADDGKKKRRAPRGRAH